MNSVEMPDCQISKCDKPVQMANKKVCGNPRNRNPEWFQLTKEGKLIEVIHKAEMPRHRDAKVENLVRT
jgi:hypothetical protein